MIQAYWHLTLRAMLFTPVVAEYSLKISKLESWSVESAAGKLKMVEYNAGGAGEGGGEGLLGVIGGEGGSEGGGGEGEGGDGGEGGEGHGCPKLVPVVTREAMEDQASGMGPHRLGFPERLSVVSVLSLDQPAGIVDRSPSELRSSEVRVVSLDQEAGREPPRDGDLRGTMREMSEMHGRQCPVGKK